MKLSLSNAWIVVVGSVVALQVACTPASRPQATLGDLVWNDLNANGVQDNGEPGKEGVDVALLDEDGDLVQATLSSELGLYAFSQLRSGTYILRVVAPQGWRLTTMDIGDDEWDSDSHPGSGLSEPFDFDSSSTDLTRDVGLLAATEEPTRTPVPTATVTSAPTVTPVVPPGRVSVELRVRFVRTEGACGPYAEFEDVLVIEIEGGEITLRQPSAGHLLHGNIASDGSFEVASEQESYRGIIHFQRDLDGGIQTAVFEAENRYTDAAGCVELFEASGETVEGVHLGD